MFDGRSELYEYFASIYTQMAVIGAYDFLKYNFLSRNLRE